MSKTLKNFIIAGVALLTVSGITYGEFDMRQTKKAKKEFRINKAEKNFNFIENAKNGNYQKFNDIEDVTQEKMVAMRRSLSVAEANGKTVVDDFIVTPDITDIDPADIINLQTAFEMYQDELVKREEKIGMFKTEFERAKQGLPKINNHTPGVVLR